MVVLWHEGTSHPAFNCRKLADEEKHAKNSSSMKQSGSNLTSSNLVVPILLRAGVSSFPVDSELVLPIVAA